MSSEALKNIITILNLECDAEAISALEITIDNEMYYVKLILSYIFFIEDNINLCNVFLPFDCKV